MFYETNRDLIKSKYNFGRKLGKILVKIEK